MCRGGEGINPLGEAHAGVDSVRIRHNSSGIRTRSLKRRCKATCRKLLRLPTHNLGLTKRIINEGQSLSPSQSQHLEIDGMVELINDVTVRDALMDYLDTH